jgi:hypothetical protein
MQYTAGLTIKKSSFAGGEDVGEVVLHRLLQLLVRTGARITVGPPAEELGGVPESIALHVLVTDFDDQIGSQRDEGEVFLGVPSTEL